MCVCVCARARRVRVRGRAPRSPARPTPASCSPRCDARRIPNARSHPPGRLHSHTHAHSRARTHPRSRTPGSALLGRSQRPLCPGPPEPPECGPRGLWSGPASLFLAGPASGPRPLPEGAPRASPLPYHARPGRGRARSPIPGRGAQLWLPGLPPHTRSWPPPPRLRRRPRRVFPRSFLPPFPVPASPFISSLFSHLLPVPRPLSLPLSLRLSCRRPLSRPLLPTALRCLSHSPHYTGRRPPPGPRVREINGRPGDLPRTGPAATSALRSLHGSWLWPGGRRSPALASAVADSSHLARA